MKILQSYFPDPRPEWIEECLASVGRWTESRGWRREVIGDELLDFAPNWVREKCAGNMCPLTDFCRLEWLARELATEEAAMWVDADVLVFAPELIDVPEDWTHGFAAETVLRWRPGFVGGPIGVVKGFNTSVIMFRRGDPLLDEYREFATRLLGDAEGPVPRLLLGPNAWNGCGFGDSHAVNALEGFDLLDESLLAGKHLGYFARHLGRPVGGANLCHFQRTGEEYDARMLDAVHRLLDTLGAELNP